MEGLGEKSDGLFKVWFCSLECELQEGRDFALLTAHPQPWKSTGLLITLSKYLNK